jgi:hypothetical protein
VKEPTEALKQHYDLLKDRIIRDVVWIDDPQTGNVFPTLVLNWSESDRVSGEVPMAVVTTDTEGTGFLNHNLKGGAN